MKTLNAKITSTSIEFDPEIAGTNGRHFYLRICFKKKDKVEVCGFFNFLKIPQILEKLEIDSYDEIVGQYVKVPKQSIGDKFLGFTNIFDTKNDWIEVDDRYFGSEYYSYFMKGFKEEMREENEN